jgi:hypothetical protein
MSKEEKKTPVKATAKAEVAVKPIKPIKPVAKQIPAKHVPTVHVFSTIDVLMDNLRRNYIENIAYPWDRVSLEPVIPARKATIAIPTSSKPKFTSTS